MEARQRGGPAAAETTALWGHEHLPLLARARSKDSVEYLLQALWRTRRTGLDAADRAVVRDILQIQTDSELDPVRISPPSHLYRLALHLPRRCSRYAAAARRISQLRVLMAYTSLARSSWCASGY